MKNSKLTIAIFASLVIGVFIGWLFPGFAVKLSPLAKIFLNMVKMIIAPLLFSTLVVGIAGHGDVKNLGKIGLKTLIYFEVVTTIALCIGLLFGNIFQPGVGFGINFNPEDLKEAKYLATINPHNSLSDMFIGIFPTSVVQAMADGNLLQIVVFSIFFAIAICAVGKKAKPIMDLLKSTADIMFKFTEYVMLFAPLGILGAIASTVGANGIGILKSYAKIICSLYGALIVFILLILYIVCKIVKISVKDFISTLQEPALLAFSTASSEAALPKAMEIMEKFGVPKNIVAFVMPTGYTFNLDGSTLYLALAVMFSTQIVGIHLNIEQQLMIMLALMIASKGIAAVPRVSLIVLAGTLATFNIPIIGVAIILGIDQILDMGRTTINLIGNCIATVVIAKWENQFNYNKMQNYITARKNGEDIDLDENSDEDSEDNIEDFELLETQQ